MKKDISEQAGPADTRVFGRLEDIATRVGRLEQSDQKLDEFNEKLDKIISFMNSGGQSVTSGDSLSERLEKCEARMNTFDNQLQRNEHEADERIKNYEMRSNKKMDSMTERVDQFGALMDTLTTNNINSKMMSADNTDKIVAIKNQLEPLEEFKTKSEEQMTKSASSIVANSESIVTLKNQLQQKSDQITDLGTKVDLNGAKTSTGEIAFDCYRTTNHDSGVVTYNGCSVDTTGGAMDPNTGKFKAKRAGLYQVHFTGEAYPGKGGCIKIMKGSTELSRIYSSKTDHHRGLSISRITQLQLGDDVSAQNCGSGYNALRLYADGNHQTIFKGFFLAPL